MHLRVIAVGRVRERYIAAACDDFLTRLRPYYAVEVVEVKASTDSNRAAALHDEAARILRCVQAEDRVWLLDRAGEQVSSEDLSRRLTSVAEAGVRRLALIVAGTYGAGDALRTRAGFVWSLSHLTFLHEWARAIALEQIYRAAKIARNEPYHH